MFKTLLSKTFVALTMAGMLTSTTAQADTTFTFYAPSIDVGASVGDLPVNGGDRYGDPITFTKNGISIITTANGSNSVYWDQTPNLGGLGVHLMTFNPGTGNPINAGAGDSIQFEETLNLVFNQSVRIKSIRFANHGNSFLTNEGLVSYTTQPGGVMTTTAFGNLAPPIIIEPVNSISFTNPGGANGFEFYLAEITVEAIPEPSTYLLLGSTLGLVALSRSRKRVTS